MEYDFTIKHRKGKDHVNADSLSRMYNGVPVLGVTMDRFKELQDKDMDIKKIIDTLDKREKPEDRSFRIENGILLHKWVGRSEFKRNDIRWQRVVPNSLKYEVMRAFHDDPLSGGHLVFKKMFHKIRERYWWKGMKKEIQHWVDSCKDCATRKTPNNLKTSVMMSIEVGEPFETIGMDFVGPLKASKRKNK